MAVNDISGILGYPGLAGATALTGVVAAAAWIRGLDPHARLPRYAPWLFLLPAGLAAIIAALSSGTIVSLTAALAAALTVCAVLAAKELESAARLLAGAAEIALGAALVSLGAALTKGHDAWTGTVLIAFGAARILRGVGLTAPRHTNSELPNGGQPLVGAMRIAFGAAAIAAGAGGIAPQLRFITSGPHSSGGQAFVILIGAGLIVFGAAAITSGVRAIGPHVIMSRARRVIEWATIAPRP
jgi:hypothetical protein